MRPAEPKLRPGLIPECALPALDVDMIGTCEIRLAGTICPPVGNRLATVDVQSMGSAGDMAVTEYTVLVTCV